ncbi:MAG: 50S ribosomal protein L15 [Candidatus Cloacimonas sp. 4484_209]|nr:MAG: 50S ribosomal protein L15 [Candidatus Cloacimonas sp. 4484_209]
MKIHELKPPKGATRKKKRLGIGSSSGRGGTCGKGSKGQRSRSGSKHYAWFEGGQMPLQRRIPKRGMVSHRKRIFQIVNISKLNSFNDGETVDAVLLQKKGIIKKSSLPVKILGNGSLSKNLTVRANAFSKKAIEIIIQKGGKIEITSA